MSERGQIQGQLPPEHPAIAPADFAIYSGLRVDMDGQTMTVHLETKEDVQRLRAVLRKIGNPWRGYQIRPTLEELGGIESAMKV